MNVQSDSKVWTVEITIEEDPDRTEAKAVLHVEEQEFAGWGRARRNPRDPDRPKVGEELASARALSDLAHKLLDAAAAEIEEFEGRPVQPHG